MIKSSLQLLASAAMATAILLTAAQSKGLSSATPAEPSAAITSPLPLSAQAKTPQPGHIHTSAAPTARILSKVDESKRTTLLGHVSSALRHGTDLGRIAPSTPAQHLVMVLKASDEQRHELRRVLDQQQDPKTENYHQWLTPDQFGQYFGVHDSDIAQVSSWLQSHGFTVEDVSKGKRVIHFSGTTGQLENAFKTEMHSYNVNGEKHVANNSEISVPEALSPVISGVTMNNFFRKSHMTPVRQLKDVQNPLYTSSSTVHYVGPWDFAKIYNTFPLLNAGITGKGSSIAVVGRSDILLSDVQTYRQLFDLPVNDPIFIHAGPDNGTQPGDDGESDLDVEISGGIAQQAQVYFVIGTPTFLVDGITNSVEYIVENNLADIMSISYGSCESVEGAGGNAFNNQAFEQAAAQGISIFVSSGDNGPAECDDQNDSWENLGYSTGGESSTPYNVSVGGTGLAESETTTISSSILTTSTTGPEYWATTPGQAPYWGLSALSYIPETPWNISKVADYSASPTADLAGLWSGSGGISSYYIQPSWQRGSSVYTSDPAYTQGGNWVTNVNFTNAGSGYTTAPTPTFTGGGCVTEPVATTTISGGSVTAINFNFGTQGGTLAAGRGFGCTSAPTITFTAAPNGGTTATATTTIGPMVNTPPLVAGVPHRYTPDLVLNADDGNDATLFCSEGNCEYSGSGSAVSLVNAGLVGGTSVAAPSMAGIQALINQANGGRQGNPNYIYYALSAAQTESGCNSAAEVYNATGVGSTCAFHDITEGDNLICGASTCVKGTYPTALSTQKMGWLAAQGFDLATGLGSVNAYNLATQWSTASFASSDTTLSLSQTSGIPQGTPITFSGTVAAGSGTGTPTGDVAFILSNGEFGQTLNISGDANDGAFNGPGAFATLSGGTFTATLSNLPAGSYTVTARYAGDANFASSLSTPVPVTVNGGNSTVTITPQFLNDTTTCLLTNQSTYNYGQLAWIPVQVSSNTGAGVPTGTVTITVDGATWGTETLDPNGYGYLAAGAVYTNSCIYDFLFTQGPLLTGGTHTIGASYSGDGTFSAATATPVQITVNPLSVTPTLSVGAQNITSGFTVPLVASFASAFSSGSPTTASGPTGTVTFTDTTTGTVLATANVVPTVVESILGSSTSSYPSYSYPASAAGSTTLITTSGANAVTASYSGDSNYTAKTSAAATVTVDATAPTATTTTVTSSANPTTLAGRPTFTATIAAPGGTAPTSGTVTFYDGTTLLGTGTVGTAHTATFRPGTTPAFVGGAHSITAVYGGIAADGPSTSPVFTENVTKGTGTFTMAMKTVGLAGQNFTITAVMTPSTSNAVYPPNQGLVQFYDGTTLIGSAQPMTINRAQGGYGLWEATLTVSNFTAGTHSITAQYSDVNFTFTTSTAQTVKVYSAPAGNLELAVDAATGLSTASMGDPIYISGWAGDAVDGAPLTGNVKVYVDGVAAGAPTLSVSRPDVVTSTGNSAYINSGFYLSLAAGSLGVGNHTITATATDSDGLVTLLGTKTVIVGYQAPFGNLELAVDATTASTTVLNRDSIYISGWICDAVDGSPLGNVKVYIDGALAGVPTLGTQRSDVSAAYGTGCLSSGYYLVTSAGSLSAGAHTVTVVGINSHGVSATLNSQSITVQQSAPIGGLDLAVNAANGTTTLSASSGTLFVEGWAADYNSNGPVASVQVLIDGNVVGTAALGQGRPDVASYYKNPNWANTGYTFATTIPSLSAGAHTVTATATDALGLTTALGPLTINVTP